MTDNELKPCPFCGGEARLQHGPFIATMVSIKCTKCGINTPLCDRIKEAIEKWNTRTITEIEVKVID